MALFSPAATIAGNEGSSAPELAHPLVGVEHDLALRSSHHAPLEDPLVDLVGEARGLGDVPELLVVLVPAKALDQSPRRHQLRSVGGELLQLAQAPDARVRVVVADPPMQPLGGAGEQLALGRRPLELGGHLAPGTLDVAKIGQEDAVAGAHDRQAAGAAEPGQPTKVRDRVGGRVPQAHQIADQELVELLLRHQGSQPLGTAFAAHPSASFSISSASR